MDPISTVGLVANIVQLVTAAGNAFTVCREIYTLGSSIEDTRMAFTSKQLHEAYIELVSDSAAYISFSVCLVLLGSAGSLTLQGFT